MRRIGALSATVLLFTIGCGDDGDSSPTAAPGDDLIGSWTARTSSGAEEQALLEYTDIILVFESDGIVTGTFVVESQTLTVTSTWSLVGDTLVITAAGETTVFRGTYSIRGDILTLVHSGDGIVETYERT